MSKKIWTEEENKHITQIYKLYDRKELAEIFECTERQIYTKLRKLGLIIVESNKVPEGCKKCNICNEIRSLDEFYNNKSKFDGKASECKHCAREMSIIKLRKKKAEKERLQALQVIDNFLCEDDEFDENNSQLPTNNIQMSGNGISRAQERFKSIW